MRLFLLTTCAMVAFAANSILCRLALGGAAIDALGFTAVRLGSGALTLALITNLRGRPAAESTPDWRGAIYLTLYALPFSLAYVRITTGTGALLLFGAVQLTMIALGLRSGERPSAWEWIALVGAASGVGYLVFPGVSAPDPIGATLMVVSGIGWGLYSIAGKGGDDPAFVTATNFRRAAILVVPLVAVAWAWVSISARGALLAIASGALASGLGYVIWYAALRYLSATRAALVQLSVPLLAAAGGALFVAEQITLRLAISSGVILGSIALGTLGRNRAQGE